MLEEKTCPLCQKSYGPPIKFCQIDGQALQTTSTLVGRVLHGKYRIDDWLGGGGMATVYRATYLQLSEPVAVKVLNPDMIGKEKIIKRFRDEARVALRINHPNAIRVYNYDITEDNLYYIVMEIVQGRTLSELIREGPLDYARAVKLLAQTCDAVEAAHRQGIIHRDLKPDNMIVREEDGQELMKVLDFGIAKLHESVNQEALQDQHTKAGTVLGTPLYMSPEQCRHMGRDLKPTSDVYSLGVIAYEMLSGRVPLIPPDNQNNWGAWADYVGKEPPVPLRELAPQVPTSIERVVMRALQKAPEARQESAQVLAQELRSALREAEGRRTDPGATTVVGLEATTLRFETKKRIPLLPAGGVAVLLVLLAAGIGYWQLQKPASKPTAATTVNDGGEMVLIPGGKFRMGRNNGEPDEGPEHEVAVADFYLDKYEITNQQYKKFLDETRHRLPKGWDYQPRNARYPVTGVTWSDASAYAKWAGKRLPTEEEWEYAARGGEKQLLYPWGNDWHEDYANSKTGSKSRSGALAAVGSFDKDISAFGVYDMAGNVSEWVESLYWHYGTQTPHDQRCPDCRIYRGGNYAEAETANTYRWSSLPDLPGDAERKKDYEESVFPKVGFRCAKSR